MRRQGPDRETAWPARVTIWCSRLRGVEECQTMKTFVADAKEFAYLKIFVLLSKDFKGMR